MIEIQGQVTHITAVEDKSWTGCVVRMNSDIPHLPFIHIFTPTHGPFFQTAFALQKLVVILVDGPLTVSQVTAVVWNNVTDINMYRFFRATLSRDL